MDEEVKRRFEVIEKRLDAFEGKTTHVHKEQKENNLLEHKEGSTAHKILILKNENFFDKPKSISEIVGELKSKDYHLKASDLTLPLRKIVRKNILIRTKRNPIGSEYKNWMYLQK